jgi:growth arrest-specific protein 8
VQAVAVKNAAISQLERDLLKVSKAHNDVIHVYEAKLRAFGLPPEELGFSPLLTHTSPGPAGLVVGA